MNYFKILLMSLFIFSANASERTPFTNIDFGLFMGWGDFIKVENDDHFNNEKTHFLIEINGKGYKGIIEETKEIYGEKYKCQLAEHFLETMEEINVTIDERVDLKLYLYSAGHEVIEVKDIPVSQENLDKIKFKTEFCK